MLYNTVIFIAVLDCVNHVHDWHVFSKAHLQSNDQHDEFIKLPIPYRA